MSFAKGAFDAGFEAVELIIRHERERRSCEAAAMDTHRALTRRVQMQVRALKNDNFDAFLHYVNESGMASWTLLQNVIPAGCIEKQDMAFTIALCQQLLAGEGAVRIHGGCLASAAHEPPSVRTGRTLTGAAQRLLWQGRGKPFLSAQSADRGNMD